MTITRGTVETILLRRAANWMAAAGMDAETHDGTNADLNDPIGVAIRRLGGTVADATAVVDADLGGVGGAQLDELLDLAELRLLENVLGALTTVDVEVGPRSEKLGQLGGRIEAAIDRKRGQIARTYGRGMGALEAGVITLDFAERGDG